MLNALLKSSDFRLYSVVMDYDAVPKLLCRWCALPLLLLPLPLLILFCGYDSAGSSLLLQQVADATSALMGSKQQQKPQKQKQQQQQFEQYSDSHCGHVINLVSVGGDVAGGSSSALLRNHSLGSYIPALPAYAQQQQQHDQPAAHIPTRHRQQ
jgi:hypothetical protein